MYSYSDYNSNSTDVVVLIRSNRDSNSLVSVMIIIIIVLIYSNSFDSNRNDASNYEMLHTELAFRAEGFGKGQTERKGTSKQSGERPFEEHIQTAVSYRLVALTTNS